MKNGSVIVDLASEQGGNCELTEPGQVVKQHGVTIIGYTDLPSRLAAQASQLYATNLRHLLTDMCPKKDGALVVDFNDEVVRGATVVKGDEITWPPPPPKLSAAPAPKPAGAAIAAKAAEAAKPKQSGAGLFVAMIITGAGADWARGRRAAGLPGAPDGLRAGGASSATWSSGT